MRCEYFLFLAFCVIGLALQIWLLVNEFTRSSLPLITQKFENGDVLPAVTVCFPLDFSVQKTEWLNYLEHILESPAEYEAVKFTYTSVMTVEDSVKHYDGCKARFELGKSKNR